MLPERRDPETLLLEAIRGRDARATLLLAQWWVHRSGLAALESFRNQTLRPRQGEDASLWLDEQLQAPLLTGSSGGPPASLSPEPAVPPQSEAPFTPEAPLEQRVFAEVDAAIAVMLATFPEEQAGLRYEPALEVIEPPQQETFEASPSERSSPERVERRWHQLPGAARLIEVARLGQQAASRWKRERPWRALLAETSQPDLLTDPEQPLVDPMLEREPDLRLPPGPEQRQPQSASGRLQQQLNHAREARLTRVPAPRPAGLAELKAWLPDADLPQAS